jgi:hypothetical protein
MDALRECLLCGRRERSTLFLGVFCSRSCHVIYVLRQRLGLRVRKGL